MSVEKMCRLCPRECNAVRVKGMTGACGVPSELKLARAALHYWEEPCISGQRGSGTVFFSGCPLGCVYCQNREISSGKVGKTVSEERLVEIFFELKEKGAHNINLVTPTHYVPQIIKSIKEAKKKGLDIPFVYNTSGYEKLETLRMLEGLIDIYLPDLKYFSPKLSRRYSNANDYFEVASRAIGEMYRQVGKPRFNGDMMTRGMIVRHLVLPGCTNDSIDILKYLAKTFDDGIYISIMNQYTPMSGIAEKYPELAAKITDDEYQRVIDCAIELGITQAFVQDGETAEQSFIPNFDCEGV